MAFSVGPGIQLGGGIVLGAPNLGPPGIGTVITTSTTSSYTTYAVTVPFTAPCPNVVCSPVLYYQASSVPPGQATTGTTSPLTVGNLQYKIPYTFTVSAVNANGVGAASVTSNSIPGYGQIYSWGYNNYNQLGLGGIAGTSQYTQPTIYGLTTTWNTATSNTKFNSMWIQANGTLWGWGYNGYGQTGVNNTTQYSSPKQVGALTNWLQVSGSYTMAAIKTDGTLWTWGYAAQGQNGLGNLTQYNSPKQVGASTNWKQVSSSPDTSNGHVLAVKTDNTLWAWGYNGQGQLGTSNLTTYSSPKQIGALSIWAGVVAGYYFSLAVDTSGKLWAWGQGSNGTLGLNNTTGYSSPKQVGFLTNWSSQQLYTGNQYTSGAIKTDGTLWMWGNNGYGQLGNGTSINYSSPKQVGALTTWRQLAIGQYQSGYQHTLGITADGKLWGWGYNGNYSLGLGNANNYSSPKQVGTSSNWHAIGAGGLSSFGVQTTNVFGPLPPTNLTATALNANTFKVTLTSPTFTSQPQNWTVTLQPSGQTQTGQSLTQYYYNLPVAGIGVSPINYAFTATTTNPVGTSVYSTPSNNATGTTYLSTWGYNGYGALGTNNTTSYSSPKNLGTYAGWGWQYNTISTGNYTNTTAAITNDGKLFTWGYNNYGQLGNNTTNNYSSPVQLGANSNWATVSIDQHGLAVDTSGRLWSWGYNGYGQLGNGNTANYSSPKQVGALTNWAKVYTSYYSSYAIKTDGSMWSWGYGGYSKLGNGSATSYSSPKQIGGSTGWVHIAPGFSSVLAINGTGGYGWGQTSSPAYYEFFVGSSGTYSTPAGAGVGPGQGVWRWCSQTTYGSNSQNAGFIVTTGGALWYGGNGVGGGNGGLFGINSNSQNTYGQVGALTNWWWVQGGDQHVIAMTTSGTIYAWGYNGYGQLGLGDTSNRSSPVQIGTLSNWIYPLAPAHNQFNVSPAALGQYTSMLQHT